MKRFATILLALVMILSLTVPAFAAENTGKITVQGATNGKVYDIYKIFDLTKNGDAVAYTIDSDWVSFFAGDGANYLVDTEAEGLSMIVVDGVKMWINITEDNVADFAQAALEYAVTLDPDVTKTAEGSTVEFTDLELGYYLVYPQGATDIVSSYASICSLTSTTPTATVQVKAEYPEIVKDDDKVSADWGEVVNYTLTGKVPNTTGFATYTYEITDTMSDGLTFNNDIKVFVDDTEIDNTNYSVTNVTDRGFTLTIKVIDLQDYVGKEIRVTYSATVNENAITEVEKNGVVLKYSNDPNNAESFTETPIDEEEVYSLGIVIDKVNSTGAKLAGAKFVLKKGDLYYKLTEGKVTWVALDKATVVETDSNGSANFYGLAEGTYSLVEIEAPAGYNKLTEEVSVEVKPTTNGDVTSYIVTSEITNQSGSELPSTGGMGTTMFYLFGGIMVLAAVVLLVTKKRMSNVQ